MSSQVHIYAGECLRLTARIESQLHLLIAKKCAHRAAPVVVGREENMKNLTGWKCNNSKLTDKKQQDGKRIEKELVWNSKVAVVQSAVHYKIQWHESK